MSSQICINTLTMSEKQDCQITYIIALQNLLFCYIDRAGMAYVHSPLVTTMDVDLVMWSLTRQMTTTPDLDTTLSKVKSLSGTGK